MKVWDLHCDTLYRLRDAARKGEKVSFRKNDFHLDLEKMKQGDYLLQCMACFVDLKEEPEVPLTACMEMIDRFYQIVEQYPEDVMQVASRQDLKQLVSDGRLGLMLTVEEGAVCMDSLSVLRDLFRLGVRMMTFTWNAENGLGSPNYVSLKEDQCAPDTEHGLKEKGIEFLEEMERCHIAADVSHLSDAGIRDVLRYSRKPFAASHSNARAVCPHPRNLTDEMLREMGERGCLVGLNYYGTFLNPSTMGTRSAPSRIRDMILHAKHIINVGGEDLLGLGSDFDGFESELEIHGAKDLPLLAEAFAREGFSQTQIEKIFWRNAYRFFDEIFPEF